jgi:exodeoxyribonuclease V
MAFEAAKALYQQIIGHFPHELTRGQEVALKKICIYLSPDHQNEDLFILKGYAGTGKTSLVAALVKGLKTGKFKVVLMAPTGRAAKVLSSYAGHTASTIHRKIYKSITGSEGLNSFVLQQNQHSNTLFIVDEASLIGTSGNEEELFSKNNLLEDLLIYIANGENCKLLLCGDVAQLPPVGMSYSPALEPDYFKTYFHCQAATAELTEVVRQDRDSGILLNATNIRKQLTDEANNAFTKLEPRFQTGPFKDVLSINGNDLSDELFDAFRKHHEEGVMIICRSNKRSNAFNKEVRARIKYFEENICAGDRLMVVKNNYFWTAENKIGDFIANGDIIEVLRVKNNDINKFGHRFAEINARFTDLPGQPEMTVKVMLDVLESEQASLSSIQNKQLFYAAMEELVNVKNKRDKIQRVKKNPYVNALQVKYAYAITCHKAQGGQWPAVFVDQGYLTDDMMNADYLRWLYTALTRAQEKVYLVNFHPRFFEEQE